MNFNELEAIVKDLIDSDVEKHVAIISIGEKTGILCVWQKDRLDRKMWRQYEKAPTFLNQEPVTTVFVVDRQPIQWHYFYKDVERRD